MIITRAPLRASFVGGGSDLPSYYNHAKGAVVSMAINKYIYVAINAKFDNAIRVSYSKTEIVSKPSELEHGIVKACLNLLGIDGGIEVVTIADIPSHGTGLGSSSSFTCALLHGLHAYKGEYVSAQQLAEECCHIEIDCCGEPIGKQDQYIAAYGGLNFIEFFQDGRVGVSPLICKEETISSLQRSLLLLYTGKTRSASGILREQSEKTGAEEKVRGTLGEMVALADKARMVLQEGRLDEFGALLHENWLLKRGLTGGISNSNIDDWYARGCAAGAVGGKILGAGGGGFLLFYAQEDKHVAIKAAIPELMPVEIALERSGSSVIFYQP